MKNQTPTILKLANGENIIGFVSAENNYLIRGNVTIRDLNRELGWFLPDKDANTIAGLVIHESRTIPQIDQIFLFYGYKFQILEKKNNQLIKLKISKI